MADDDFPPAEGDGTHAALGDISQGESLLELRVAHVAHLMDNRCAHFNRDVRPGVLNFNGALYLDFRLEDGDGLADDPDSLDGTVLDFQLHVDAPGAVQLVSLHAAE